jgi:hypothetical protein
MISTHKNSQTNRRTNHLTNLPTELLVYLMSFLDDNNNHKLVSTCKYFDCHSKKLGYLTHIKGDHTLNTMTFIERCCNHFRTLKTIEIHSLEDPHLWLADYTENIIFDCCSVLQSINPGKKVKTKKIKINDKNRYTNRTTLNINWEFFPHLEEIELIVHDVNVDSLRKCKKLKKININTSTGKIIYYNRHNNNIHTHGTLPLPDPININLKHFPDLETMELKVYDAYITGLNEFKRTKLDITTSKNRN